MAKIFSTTLLNPYVTSTDEINIRPDPQHGTVVEELSEYAARLCYNSVDKMGHSKKFLAKRIEEGHLDVFEHAKITLELIDQELDIFELAIDKEEPTLRYHEVLRNWSSGVHLVTANLRVWLKINEVLKEQGFLDSLRKQLHFIAPAIFEDVADYRPDFSVSNTKIFYLGNPLQPLVWDQSKVTLLGYNVVRGKGFGTHNSATFLVEGISRACSHQFVRSRLASFSQSSQRYIDQKGWSYIVPDSIKNNEKAMHEFSSMVEDIKVSYLWLRETGIRKEDARFILPNAMETKLVVSMYQEDWRHFIHLRALDKAAQWEIRRVGIGILEIWNELYPDAFWEEISFLNENRKELNK